MRTLVSHGVGQGAFAAQIYLQANALAAAIGMGTTATSSGARASFKTVLRVSGPAGRVGALAVSANGTRPLTLVPQGRLAMIAAGHTFQSPLVPPLAGNATSSVSYSASYLVQVPATGLLEAELEADAFMLSQAREGFSSAIYVEFRPGPWCGSQDFGYWYPYGPNPVLGELSCIVNPFTNSIQLDHAWLPNAAGALVLGVDTTHVPLFGALNPLLVVPVVLVPFVAGPTGRTTWTFSLASLDGLDVRAQVFSLSTPVDFSNGLHLICLR